MIKLAFLDIDTNEYYRKNESDFTIDIGKAKLYSKRLETFEIFNNLKVITGRNLVMVDVNVSVQLIGRSTYEGDILDKEKEKFEKLDKIAEFDLDALSEKEWREYRKLIKKFK